MMEEQKFDWKLKLKLKAEMAKRKVEDAVKNTTEKVGNFVRENPELSVAIATVAVPAACKTVKTVSNAVKTKSEEKHRMLQTYDRRTDEYLNLRRPLKPREQETLAQRMGRGESKTMILRDLGLLK